MNARLLLIDNYDSFTYNLVQAFDVLGAEVLVHRNDAITVPEAGLQFLRWVGWIPLASLGLWISERRAKAKQPAGAAASAR